MLKQNSYSNSKEDTMYKAQCMCFNGKVCNTMHKTAFKKRHPEIKARIRLAESEITQNRATIESGKYLFSEVAEKWLLEATLHVKGASTHKYSYMLNKHILPFFGNLSAASISKDTIKDFTSQKLQYGRLDGTGGLSASYIKSMIQIVNAILKFAIDNNMRDNNLPGGIKLAVQSKKTITLSSAEQQKLENFLIKSQSPTATGTLISLYMGLRIGEICALQWSDIDLEQNILTIKGTVSRVHSENDNSASKLIIDTPKTKTSFRKIPIPAFIRDYLAVAYSNRMSDYVVSQTESFVSPRTYEYRYHKLLCQAGIESKNYHILRHTFATRCIECGVDVKSLSEILGHSNVSTTLNTYVHSSIEFKRIQMNKLINYQLGNSFTHTSVQKECI